MHDLLSQTTLTIISTIIGSLLGYGAFWGCIWLYDQWAEWRWRKSWAVYEAKQAERNRQYQEAKEARNAKIVDDMLGGQG